LAERPQVSASPEIVEPLRVSVVIELFAINSDQRFLVLTQQRCIEKERK
jgi:hypothetical protein